MAETLLSILAIYLILGLFFAIAFVSLGCQRIDPDAIGAGIGFRLLIIPASTAFWPLLLYKWLVAHKRSRETS